MNGLQRSNAPSQGSHHDGATINHIITPPHANNVRFRSGGQRMSMCG